MRTLNPANPANLGIVKRLWMNPNPSSSFAAQTIEGVKPKEYDLIAISFAQGAYYSASVLLPTNLTDVVFVEGTRMTSLVHRGVGIDGDDVVFRDAYVDSASGTTLSNTDMIPQFIVGIKL
jgi:hypothetical protein